MRFSLGAWLFLVMGSVLAEPLPVDLRHAPTGPHVDALIDMGWERGADRLAETLIEQYQPGRLGLTGSTGRPAFRAWMHLWQWFDLMRREERDCLEELISRRVYRQPDGEGMTVVPPGLTPPAELRPLDAMLRDELARSEEGLGKLLPILIGDGYTPQEGNLSAILGPELSAFLARDPEFLEEFFANLSPHDFLPRVIGHLRDQFYAEPTRIRSYPGLAIAIAMVYDQQRPLTWPHHQVTAEDLPEFTPDVGEVLAFWMDANESRRLLNDLRQLRASELKFIVDAFVPPSELLWAQSHLRLSKANFARAFGEVEYDAPRIERAAFHWPNGPYTLERIRDRGGICVDQAYFAMIAGKALGLPTLFFAGQGSDGGHAWFGYWKSPGKWELDCGRYENQNYAVGVALDPQTWLPISDHQLNFLSEGFHLRPEYIASSHDLVMSRLLRRAGRDELAREAIESALETEPMNLDAWVAKAALLRDAGEAEESLRQHFAAASKQFQRFDDIQAEFLGKLAEVARNAGDEGDASRIESQIMRQNRLARSDLSVKIAADRLTALVDQGKLDEALVEYRSQIARLAPTGGGNFFYDVVRPFVVKLAASGDHRSAERALEMGRRALDASPGSILDQEFAVLEESLHP